MACDIWIEIYQKRIVTSYQQYCNDVDLYVAFVHPISLDRRNIHWGNLWRSSRHDVESHSGYSGSQYTALHIRFPWENQPSRKDLPYWKRRRAEGRSWGLKLTKRGFIEATYTIVFMIRVSFLDSLQLPTI